MDVLAIFVSLLLFYTLSHVLDLSLSKPKNLPPGPTPLPIIGSLHLLGNKPHQSLAEIAKIYGPIMLLQLGSINTLVISSAAAAKMVLQKQDIAFSNHRYLPDAIHAHNHFQYSVVWLPDLFVAGTDTTSSTLEWAMAELLRNPQTMSKAKDELKKVIGEGKIIDENDILRLPYLNCIVKETLRVHTPVPLLLPRKVDTQVELNGYIIPKGTQVLVNAWAIGHDLTTWGDPLNFRPERFLTLKHDVQGFNFELIPFGAGRRICPGLPLAKRMIPIMLASLLHNFDWKLEGGHELDMTDKFGLTLQKSEPLRIVPIPCH